MSDAFKDNQIRQAPHISVNLIHSSMFGPPSTLARSIDSLISRKLEDCRPYIPELVALGSIENICTELRIPDNEDDVLQALRQNAFRHRSFSRF